MSMRQHTVPDAMADMDADSGLGTPTTANSIVAESPSPSPSPRSSIITARDDDSIGFDDQFEDFSRTNRPRLLGDDVLSWKQHQQEEKKKQQSIRTANKLSRPAMAAASVPMRCRHLPASMWLEPNAPMYSPALPPLDLAGHSAKSWAAKSPSALSPTSTTAPCEGSGGGHSSTVLVTCSAFESEDSLRRLFDVAAVKGTSGGIGGFGASSSMAARQLGAPAASSGLYSTDCQPTSTPNPRPPAGIRRRFVCGRDPRLSDNSAASTGLAVRRLPPLNLSAVNSGAGGAPLAVGVCVSGGGVGSAAQLLGEVASLL